MHDVAPAGGALLGALQLGDSLFPSGRYTLSHGLEAFVEHGLLRTAGQLEALVADYLTEALGRSDAVAVATANRAAARGDIETIVAADSLLGAMKLASESSTSSLRTGRTLLRAGTRLSDDAALQRYAAEIDGGRAPGNHAAVFGAVSAAWHLDARSAVLVELYACVAGLLGAALRTMRLDHVEAQRILRRLTPVIETTASEAEATDYEEMSAFAPTIEIMQMAHERSRLRLFAS